MALRLDRPFGDATSGMYAANASALPLLGQPYESGAPEVGHAASLAAGRTLRSAMIPAVSRARPPA